MTILETIVAHKRKEVELSQNAVSIQSLERTDGYFRQPFSLASFLKSNDKTGIIAEFKRRSPSKGIINDKADVVEVTKAYTFKGIKVTKGAKQAIEAAGGSIEE